MICFNYDDNFNNNVEVSYFWYCIFLMDNLILCLGIVGVGYIDLVDMLIFFIIVDDVLGIFFCFGEYDLVYCWGGGGVGFNW